ncbi:AMP-binding enzyme [Curtobacterium sp. 24E2]
MVQRHKTGSSRGTSWRKRTGNFSSEGAETSKSSLRGFRVELGEVEAKVAVLEGIEAAAAVVLGEGSAARLVVFIVAPVAVLRRDIVRRLDVSLPHYMLPSDVIQISSIPRTGNGKIDRRALALLAEQPKKEAGL